MGCTSLCLALLLAPPAGRPEIAEAERLAAQAVELAARDEAGALDRARRALALTAEFEPTAFVTAGRKGEVLEDSFRAARAAYRRHRAVLYGAVGAVLARRPAEAVAASRYSRRALLLEATPSRALDLARLLNALGRGREALEALERGSPGLRSLTPEAVAVLTRAADVARLPSAQSEIDRVRLLSTLGDRARMREGPLETPAGARLSTTAVVRLEEVSPTVVYAAEASCRTCSTDIAALARQVPKDVRVLALPAGEDDDLALRQVITLFGLRWPLLVGEGVAARLSLPPRSVLLVARGGWTVAVVAAPFGAELGSAVALLQAADVQEKTPRPSWNRQAVDRTPLALPPALLPEGLAPGEDEPLPGEFVAAVEAFRAGRKARAEAMFGALAARGDGWLLPPEARLNQALCLAGQGRRDAARRILLRTGDSRFEDAIDRLLEVVGAGE